MVHLEVAAWYAQDSLRGDNVTELRVKFLRKIEDTVPAGDDQCRNQRELGIYVL